jgi:hypothetical protein
MLKLEGEANVTLSTLGGKTDNVKNPDSYKYFKKVRKVLKRKCKYESILDKLDDIILENR